MSGVEIFFVAKSATPSWFCDSSNFPATQKMVAARVIGDLSKFHTYCTRTETLSEWITTVRYKKGVIRRQKKNRDLRVAAVLATAIQRAETELRRKQTERAQRWAQVRAQVYGGESFESNEGHLSSSSCLWNDREGDGACSSNNNDGCSQSVAKMEEEQDAAEVAKLWTSELVGLDNLFNDLNQIKTVVAR